MGLSTIFNIKNYVWKWPDLLLAFYSGNDISDNLKILSTKQYRPYFKFDGDDLKSIDKDYLNKALQNFKL